MWRSSPERPRPSGSRPTPSAPRTPLRPDPAQHGLSEEIRDNLVARIAEAECEGTTPGAATAPSSGQAGYAAQYG
ncbi:hypothetical protein SVIO_106790 [Streptomyces violaceusniger]|uniref:Uncharacterized protein n=1 Tax=Streptomyces violaceusniger TaxID=68280 RepID=A0A4D4LL81_STRVO|nr:hypothetical protein SVIO_106790 [Streptomyces violaceusniger]